MWGYVIGMAEGSGGGQGPYRQSDTDVGPWAPLLGIAQYCGDV